jgi:hypothetical protein
VVVGSGEFCTVLVLVVSVTHPARPKAHAASKAKQSGFITNNTRAVADATGFSFQSQHVQIGSPARFSCTMKKNLIALMFLGLVAIFLAGCTPTTETTTTTTRSQGVQYGH